MYIPPEEVDGLQKLIQDLYTRDFDEALVQETARIASRLMKSDYFALRLFPNVRKDLPIIVSNNPPDFVPVYLSVIEKDFLCAMTVERGTEYVLRREPEWFKSIHQDFIHTVQKARPISDVVYSPLRVHGTLYGYWALARAGEDNEWYSDGDLEIFRFLVGFMSDAFARALLPAPPDEDLAYLDSRGRPVAAGSRISEAFRDLFGGGNSPNLRARPQNRARFQESFERFLRSPGGPGFDRSILRSDRREYRFLFRRAEGLRLCPERWSCPCGTARLLDSRSLEQVLPVRREDSEDLSPLIHRYGLTPRECEVVRGIYQAKSNKMIAYDLRIDESTVKRHSHNIYEKTGFRSRVELVQGLNFDQDGPADRT